MSLVLVTGATGLIGRQLCQEAAHAGQRVRAALRREAPLPPGAAEAVVVGEIGAHTDWQAALCGVDSIVHLAAVAHANLRSQDDVRACFEINERGTQRLAEAAGRWGVRRLVYLSSVKVNGEDSGRGVYTVLDPPDPQDFYGISKWRAEQHLAEIATHADLQVTIVRSPLVYGPGVRANFLRLLRCVDLQLPLPLGAVENRRSLVSVWNLCDLLLHVLTNTAATGRTLMVSDGEDLSTPELIRRLAAAMERKARLVRVPVAVLEALGSLLRRKGDIDRLCRSLAVDITKTSSELGWRPPVPLDEGLMRTVRWYREGRSLLAA